MASKDGGKAVEKPSSSSEVDDVQTNPRGIPKAPFVDKVEDYVTSHDDVEPTLRRFQEMISKYQFMESNLQRRVAGLDEKLPDIRKTLETVKFLQTRRKTMKKYANEDEDDGSDSDAEPIETIFELNDTLYSKATVPPTDEVYLWLGANVMLSYPIDEADALLQQKLTAAQTTRSNCEEDLEFLREQITTMEVAIARVYNWDVVQKRKGKIGGEASKSKGKTAGPPDG